MVGEETDGSAQPFPKRWRVPYSAPVRTLKRRCHFLHQPGCKRRLANAPHAQDRHQSRAVLQDPLGEFGHLLSAANEPEHIWCLTPILAPFPRRPRTL